MHTLQLSRLVIIDNYTFLDPPHFKTFKIFNHLKKAGKGLDWIRQKRNCI